MTSKEAIKWLDTFKDHTGITELSQAFDVAIELLKQEPCEDAISRQAVLDINEHHHGQMPNHVNHEIWEEIKALPSVKPQPKTGRWTADKKCSRCGCSSMLKLCIENYCANCGAKMVELQESEEE